MKHQIKLSKATAQMAALCYQGMAAAREYARGISSDHATATAIRNEFINIAATLNAPMERLERRIPKSNWENFALQVKDNDAIRLDNIKAMYVRMVPEQQEWVERLMTGILNGELINFESIQEPIEQ